MRDACRTVCSRISGDRHFLLWSRDLRAKEQGQHSGENVLDVTLV